jgi:hypothetical protein
LDARDLLRKQLAFSGQLLNTIMADVTDPVARSMPAGQIQNIATIYAHTVADLDHMFTNMLQGKTLLLTNDDWMARTGIPDPNGPMMTPEFISGININLEGAKAYAAAVFAQADLRLRRRCDLEPRDRRSLREDDDVRVPRDARALPPR